MSLLLHGTLRQRDELVSLGLRIAHAHEHAWQQILLGVRELGAQRHRAGVRIHGQVREQQLARQRVDAVVLQHQFHAPGVGLLPASAGNGFAQGQQLGAALREVHVDRVDLLDGGQLRRLATAHQGAFGHERAPDAAGDRRGHCGVLQIQLGTRERCLGLAQTRLGGIQLLLAHGLHLDQRAVSVDHGLGRSQFGLGGLVAGAVGPCIDAVQRHA
jgi:hypothetical protein